MRAKFVTLRKKMVCTTTFCGLAKFDTRFCILAANARTNERRYGCETWCTNETNKTNESLSLRFYLLYVLMFASWLNCIHSLLWMLSHTLSVRVVGLQEQQQQQQQQYSSSRHRSNTSHWFCCKHTHTYASRMQHSLKVMQHSVRCDVMLHTSNTTLASSSARHAYARRGNLSLLARLL